MKASALSVAAVVLAGAAVFAIGASFIDGSAGYSGLSPRFLPTLVAVGLATCGALLGVEVLRARAQRGPDRADETPASALPSSRQGVVNDPVRNLAWVIFGLVFHLLTIGHIGFVAASVVLMVCVARGYGSPHAARDAGIALALTLPVWLLFSKVIGVSLPLCPVLGL
jgi:putative tricarboxylic transport membrane protein